MKVMTWRWCGRWGDALGAGYSRADDHDADDMSTHAGDIEDQAMAGEPSAAAARSKTP
jgi:hypothetical protein